MDKPHNPPPDSYNKPRLRSHRDLPPPLSSVFGGSLPPFNPIHIDLPRTIPDLEDPDFAPVPLQIIYPDFDVKPFVDSSLNVDGEFKNHTLGIRRRGRPARAQVKAAPVSTPPSLKKKDEEDVCFICFDGGSLVVCDRRGCPKAYHPSCIKRDEAFFRSKAKWNCGWHICTNCQKASYYMCYTCPFSLCKGCIKGADYQCVRGSNGFCGTCMNIIMLFEKSTSDGESVQVDFDDKSSWEYLFKMYWVYLKEKLSLTVDELIGAKNPWKESSIMNHKVASSEPHDGSIDKSQGDHNSFRSQKSQRKRSNRQQSSMNKFSYGVDVPSSCEGTQFSGTTKWATKELMEFVAHMRNGDTTRLSPFDVQALLLEYVKKNNLRDPQQQCQIICDSRLINLFGKSGISHFEMLKLLESHITIKETAADNATSTGTGVVINPVEREEKYDCEAVDESERKRKTCKKADVSRRQLNADEYAAIGVQNISLIYLQRDLIVSLIDDENKCNDMVVGSIVRIQIPNNDEKHDFHRLVQVVGISKISTPYTVGEKTIDVMLDILNLDKRETVSIDGISNQEFTEEECRRLRRSIKCGLVKRFSVAEILNKGRELHALKINNLLKKEISRLNHLHDQASEKGNADELRDFAEKLHRLKSPEEQQRRLLEILEVRSDPTMDPSYDEVEEDKEESNKKRQGSLKRSRISEVDDREGELTSPPRETNSNVSGSDVKKNLSSTSEQSRNISLPVDVNKEGDCLPSDRTYETAVAAVKKILSSTSEQSRNISLPVDVNKEGDCLPSDRTCETTMAANLSSTSEQSRNISLPVDVNKEGDCLPSDRTCETTMAAVRGFVPNNWNVTNQAKDATPVTAGGHCQVVLPEASIPPLTIGIESSNDAEVEKIWQYQDATGKVQGPFSMTHLRRWNDNGFFPPDVRVWRITESQNDSVLLTNTLNGCYNKSSSIWHNDHLLSLGRGNGLSLGGFDNHHSGSQRNGGTDSNLKSVRVGIDFIRNINSEKKDQVAVCDTENEPMISTGSSSPSKDICAPAETVNSNQSGAGNLEVAHDSLKHNNSWSYPSLMNLLSSATLSLQPPVTEPHQAKGNYSLNEEDQNSQIFTLGGYHSQPSRKKHSSGEVCSSRQSSGQSWTAPPAHASSRGWNFNTSGLSLMDSFKPSEKIREIVPGIPYSMKPLSVDVDINQSVSSSVLVQNSGPSWISASSLPGGGRQLPNHLAGGWGSGYSPAPGRIIEDLNTSLISASGLNDHEPTAATINWEAIVDEPNDFNPLVDESVSDLLAEVEAMECLSGLANCSEGLTRDSRSDCFFSVDGFSPSGEMKVEALSSTGNLQFPFHIRVKDEQH